MWEVDKKIADGILDPLLHLIRNAIDHGIEQPEEREKAGKPRAGSVTLLFANVGGRSWSVCQRRRMRHRFGTGPQKGREKNLFIAAGVQGFRSEFCLLRFRRGGRLTSTREEAWDSMWYVRWWRRSAATFI